MSTEEQEVAGTEPKRRRRRRAPERQPEPMPSNGERPGVLKLLWADLRKQPIASEPDEVDLALYEEEQERQREHAARIGRVHSISASHMDTLRRRYWQDA